jgi:dihydrofolate synthase/folylpolyglutamate synthase
VNAPALPELLAALCARESKGMELGLEPTRRALAALGDPHLALSVVHVAGTNGKGSVSAMVESIARCAGLRAGLYTSPHLCRFAERVRVDGEPLDDARLCASLARALDAGTDLTFFETLTVAAFDAFQVGAVDLAVLEVGLGGRLDATNVVPAPLCTAITSVALDHTAVLGATLDAIAREKAGIAKRGAPMVLGVLDRQAERAVMEVVAAAAAEPVLRAPPLPAQMTVGLAGAHQRDNGAVAATIASVLSARWPGMAAAVAPGLAAVRWPGRLEQLQRGDVRVILDCAHNQHAAASLARALVEGRWDVGNATLLFGALADKPFAAMLAEVSPLCARRVYTCPKGRQPAPLAELQQIAAGEAVPDARDALLRALEIARGGTLLVTGSSYLVGELRAELLGERCDPVVAL